MTCDVGNPGPGLGETQKCGRVKPVNGNPTPPLLMTGSPTATHTVYKQMIKNMHRFAHVHVCSYIQLHVHIEPIFCS
jgi:hypothetical protein